MGAQNPDASTPWSQPSGVSQTLTPNAQQALVNAQNLARENGSANVESVHLLLGALQIEPPDGLLRELLQISGLKADEVRLYAQSALAPPAATSNEPLQLGESARNAMRLAGQEASRTYCAQVYVSHIFIACFRPQNAPGLAEVLAPLGVSADQLSSHLRALVRRATVPATADESPFAQLTAHGERAIEAAHAAMRSNFCGRISTLHLLIGVLENPEGDAALALQTLMINVEELRERAAVAAVSNGEIAGPTRRFTPAAKRALDRAKAAARDGGRSHIGSADLLMGLLPQPMLLIERAQFGARPNDPAAAILRDVDADVVRAIFNPRQAATPPVKRERQLPEDAQDLRFRFFIIFLCIQASICQLAIMKIFGRDVESALVLLMVAVMIVSGIITCAIRIFSKSALRKANWQWGLAGAIAGMMMVVAVSGVFN